MRLPERAAVVEVALSRRATLKPLRQMNGDDLASLIRHTRDNLAETRRETKSSEGIALAEMNRQLRAQYREHRRFLDGVRRQQDGVYETMLQLADIKRRLGLPVAATSPAARPRAATVTSPVASVPATVPPLPRPVTVEGMATSTDSSARVPLCPLLRRTVEKALGASGGGGGGGGGAATPSAAAASGEVAASSPIREALRRFKAGAFMTATFARPRKLPPINETEAATQQNESRTFAPAPSDEQVRRVAAGGAEVGAGVQFGAAVRTGGVARPASGGSEGRRVQRRAVTRDDLRRLLDSEPCRVYRLADGEAGFEPEPDTYVRRTFRTRPPEQSRDEDEAKRARLIDRCKQSRKEQVALAAELFKNLFPEQENVTAAKEEETPAPTPPPPPKKRAFRQGANARVASSLAECGYLRQYIRPSARPRILSPITSWNQKS